MINTSNNGNTFVKISKLGKPWKSTIAQCSMFAQSWSNWISA